MFYVYGYFTDSTSKTPFYVGKGKKYRYTSHLKKSLWECPQNTTNPFFYGKIKQIMVNGGKPDVRILKKFTVESESYEYEAKLIEKYGTFNTGGILLNISTSKGGSPSGVPKIRSAATKKSYKRNMRKHRVYDPSYDELYGEFIIENMKRKDIAIKHSVSDALVKIRLKEYGIRKPKIFENENKKRFVRKKCVKCGEDYKVIPYRANKSRYCSKKCLYNRKGTVGT